MESNRCMPFVALLLFLPPKVHAPVVISLGEDSSEEETTPEKKNPGFLGNLDMFLKEARQTVEAQEKEGIEPKRASSPKPVPADTLKEVLPPGQLRDNKASQQDSQKVAASAQNQPKDVVVKRNKDSELQNAVKTLEGKLLRRK